MIASFVRAGLCSGRDDHGASALKPPIAQRFRCLKPVFRLIPNCSYSSVSEKRYVYASANNRVNSSIGVVVFQGIFPAV